jgi:hypothetical protein
MAKKITDCNGDGCGECDVCRYLAHLEHAAAVGAFGAHSDFISVERNPQIESLLDIKYPHWRTN